MATTPFKVDRLQIEPGSGQLLTISRNAADGALKFIDNATPAGITLAELAGIGSVTKVLIVGKGGSGAEYTVIGDAITAATGSYNAPVLILVAPGVYEENLIIAKDGLQIVGLGKVIIKSIVLGNTLTVSDTAVKSLLLRNLTIINPHSGLGDGSQGCCLRMDGAAGTNLGLIDADVDGNSNPVNADYGLGGIWIEGCHFIASATGNGMNPNYQIYANTVNSLFVRDCSFYSPNTNSKTVIADCSDVLLENIAGINDLQMDYNTGNNLPVSAVQSYTVRGCGIRKGFMSNLVGGSSLQMSGITEVGSLTLTGDRIMDIEVNLSGTIQVTDAPVSLSANHVTGNINVGGAGNLYASISHIVGNILVNAGGSLLGSLGFVQGFLTATSSLVNATADSIQNISAVGTASLQIAARKISNISAQDTSSVNIRGAETGLITTADTATVSCDGCSVSDVNTASGVALRNSTLAQSPGGAGTLDQDTLRGTQAFAAANTHTITFNVDMSDTNYTVTTSVDKPLQTSAYLVIENKAVTGFDIVFRDDTLPNGVLRDQTLTVSYVVTRI
jgi:hypothetical protein